MTRHKTTGQGYVTVPDAEGVRVRRYCGSYYLSDGVTLNVETAHRAAETIRSARAVGGTISRKSAGLTVADVGARHLAWVRENKKQSEIAHTKLAMGFLTDKFGHVPADDFRGLQLFAFRELAVKSGRWNLTSVGDYSRRVVGAFAWANTRDLVSDGQVKNLERAQKERIVEGCTRARRLVRPVPLEDLLKVLPHLSAPVAGIVRFMLATGCRCAEAVQVRGQDLDRTESDCWTFTPASHKNTHRDQELTIFVGPAAQKALEPFLARHPSAFVFDPRDAVREQQARLEAAGHTLSDEGRERGLANVTPSYTTNGVRQALLRACRRAKVSAFTPHRIRHLVSTMVREKHGFEGSQALLQQKDPQVVARYAEQSKKLAREVARTLHLEVG